MSKTLFFYILKDLLKIFLMTSIVLAGIMSFGGLLKPLMQYGLTGTQVGKMLLYFLPATQTYSLSIAALFATTVVYGRLAADNEITACRASGISYTSLVVPAVVLGLILSIVSLVCLSFVVPHYMLKVERVAFDSLADVVQKSIQRSHQIKLPGRGGKKQSIYAESAQVLAPPRENPDDEVVRLHGPMFCTYAWDDELKCEVPSEFFTAQSATVVIHRTKDDVQFSAHLDEGAMFPRKFEGASLGGIGTAEFGPISLGSPIRENTKFMNITQLKELYKDPTRSREMQSRYAAVTRAEQQIAFLNTVATGLKTTGQYHFVNESEAFTLLIEPAVKIPGNPTNDKLALTCPESGPRRIRLQRSRDGQVMATDAAHQLAIRVAADLENDFLRLEFRLEDVLVSSPEGSVNRESFARQFGVPTPPQLVSLKDRGVRYYLAQGAAHTDDLKEIRSKLPRLQSGIISEIHARVSFAVSCLILVLIGCILGMMFRTGNYLSAFALSVIPALICLALTVTGQHVCESDAKLMKVGLSIVWSGNLIVLVLVVGLLGHLRRQ